jgi:hypothetical protein
MQAICLSILLVATSALTYIDGDKPGDHHRRTRGVPGNNRALLERSLKGGKGMGGMGMKDKKGSKSCQLLTIKSPLSGVEVEENDAVGFTLFAPVYDYYTDDPIGTYTSSVTYIFAGGVAVNTVIYGSYNLGFDESLEFPFQDQIMFAATSSSFESNAITGGTGEYACASGYELDIDLEQDVYFATVLTICNTCT